MSGRSRAAPLLGAALVLAGCPDARQPCPLYDCGGACVDVRVDAAHCGACGSACPTGQVCSGGLCALECEAPLAACGEGAALACAAVRTDAANCGACGVACPEGQVCAAGACARECAAPLTACGAGEGAWCADLDRDRLNCGECGHACAPGWACSAGTCVASCDAAALCDGACVDVWTDARHCGACGNACGAGARCEGAVCRDTCALDGLARCGAACADLASDAANCGACGRACAAGALCALGECVAAACAEGLRLPGRPDLVETVQSHALLAADVDGDDVPDLLLGASAGDRIVLHRGLAAGGFAPGEDAILGALAPTDAADADADGDVDLLVARGGAATAYLNDGTGRFTAGTTHAAAGVIDARFADLDRDGRMDTVIARPSYLDVWLAGAAAPATYPFIEVTALRTGDVDGDGWLDLVGGDEWDNQVLVLRNRGDGTFAEPVSSAPGARAESIETADLEGDGDADVVFFGRQQTPPYAYVLGVLRAEGGALVPSGLQAFPTTGSIYDLLVADLDGDALPDAVLGEINAYRIFRNQGDGAFAAPRVAPSGGARSMVALDADRDGRTDLVASSLTMAALEIRRQLADGAWEGPEALPFAAHGAALADLDADGRDDLLTVVSADGYGQRPLGTLEIRLSRPPGFGPPTTLSGFGWTAALPGDLDRDGAVDLVVLHAYAAGPPGVLRNRGGGELENEVPILGMEGALALADVTGDGVLDLVGTSSYPPALRVAVGYGNGGFSPPVETLLPSGGGYRLTVADVDGDGRADAASFDDQYPYPSAVVRVYPGRPDGTFGPAWETPIAGAATAVVLAAGDLDRDGYADLAAAFYRTVPGGSGARESVIAVLRGGAAGPGAPELHLSKTGWMSTLAIGDLSGGGRRDVVVFSDHSMGVLASRDGGLAPELRWALPSGASGTAAIGDLDGDLRGDLVVPAGERVLVYRGACPAP